MVRTVALCALACTLEALAADQVTLIATSDATLYESELGELANGSGEHSYAGLTFGAGMRRSAVWRREGRAILMRNQLLAMERTNR